MLFPTDAAAIEAILHPPHLLPGTLNLAKGRKLHEARETLYQPPPFPAEQVRDSPAPLVSVANVPQMFHAGFSIMNVLLTCFIVGHVSNACNKFPEAYCPNSVLILFHITAEK